VRITVTEKRSNGVIRESHEGLIIVDHLADYDEGYEAFRNIFWARY